MVLGPKDARVTQKWFAGDWFRKIGLQAPAEETGE
jgi:hypothetical protein